MTTPSLRVRVLAMVAEHPGLTCSEYAALLKVPRGQYGYGALSSRLNELAKAGTLDRVAAPTRFGPAAHGEVKTVWRYSLPATPQGCACANLPCDAHRCRGPGRGRKRCASPCMSNGFCYTHRRLVHAVNG